MNRNPKWWNIMWLVLSNISLFYAQELGEGTYSPRCTDADKFGGGKKFVQVGDFK